MTQPNVEIMMAMAMNGTPRLGEARSSTAVPTRLSLALSMPLAKASSDSAFWTVCRAFSTSVCRSFTIVSSSSMVLVRFATLASSFWA